MSLLKPVGSSTPSARSAWPDVRAFIVPDMASKLDAQLRGMGGGFLPLSMAQPYLSSGRLVAKNVSRAQRIGETHYAWRNSRKAAPGKALQWWLDQLQGETTQRALLQPQYRV